MVDVVGIDGVGCRYVGWCIVVFWVGCVCVYVDVVGYGIGYVCYLVDWVLVVFVLCCDCYVGCGYCCGCWLRIVVVVGCLFVIGYVGVYLVYVVVGGGDWCCVVFVCGDDGFVEYFWCGCYLCIWL